MTTLSSISRRGLLGAFAATAVTAAPTYSNAAGFLRGGGDIRRLKMYSGRTGENIDTIYWIEGQYVGEAMNEVNRFFRDWRNGVVHGIDTRTIDIVAATQNLLDSDQPYTLISGYRSPQTNAMLRSNSSGVARNSLHLQGRAADLRMQGRSVKWHALRLPVVRVVSAVIQGPTLSTWIAVLFAPGATNSLRHCEQFYSQSIIVRALCIITP